MYHCPQCKSTDLDVTVLTDTRLIQEDDELETNYGEARNCDHFWDKNSSMTCRDCGHNAKAAKFDDRRAAHALEKHLTRDERQLLTNALYLSIADLEDPAVGHDKEWCDIRIEEYRDLAASLGLDPDE